MKRNLVPLDEVLNFQVYKLYLLLSREHAKALKAFDLSPERWQILASLWEAGEGLSQTRLAEITLKDKPSISRLIESMIQADLVVRVQDKQDARANVIRPSQKANNSREKILNALYSHFDPFDQELGVSARKKLLEQVRSYIDIMQRLVNRDSTDA